MSNWPVVKLGDILTRIERGEKVDAAKSYNLLGVRLEGQGPFLRETVTGTQTSAAKLFRVEDGDFIYSRLFACRGAFGVITRNLAGCYVSNEFPTFVPVPNKLDVRFLKYWFRQSSIISLVDADCTGSTPLTRNRYKENFFLALEIPLPHLAEQQRIVARIEALAAQIHEAKELRKRAAEDAERIISSRMNEIFQFDEVKTTVGDFAKIQGGFAFSSSDYRENGSHQVVRIGNVRDGHLDLSRAPVRWDPSRDKRVLRYELNHGDLLISMTGTREKQDYGFIAKVPKDTQLLLNQRVGRFIIYKEIDNNYLFYFLRSPFFRDRLFLSATGTANQANIGNGDIERIKFNPHPLPEQHRIVAELDALQAEVDALKRLQAETSSELDALLPAVLDRAFKGEL